MRSATECPFTPGYGVSPEVWAGREREFADFDEVVLPRVRGRMYERARLVTGDRGVGKTVFLTHLAEDAADAGCWPVRLSLRRTSEVARELVVAVTRTVAGHDGSFRVERSLARALEVLAGVSIGPHGLDVDLDRASADARADRGDVLADLLVAAGRAAADQGTALVLLLDEVHNAGDGPLGDLCHALQTAQTTVTTERGPRGETVRRHLPIAVYLAGLPGLVDHIRRAGATFFERAAPLDFGLLSDADVRVALTGAAANHDVAIDAAALDVLVSAAAGYPYFLQVVGRAAWLSGDGPVVTRTHAVDGVRQAQTELARFYGERLRGLGDVQYDWLVAAAAIDPDERTVGAVADRLGRRSQQLGSTVAALVERGLIRPAPGRGRFRFALPGLGGYLRGGSPLP